MTPITIVCRAALPQTAEEVAAAILDLHRWPEFEGYGPLPGIRTAEFRHRTTEVVGSEISVENRDGSRHVEEVLEWALPDRLTLRLGEFSAPLSWWATEFIEVWRFNPEPDGCQVERRLELYARSWLTWPLIWLISWLLKGAIRKHLRQVASE